MKLRAVSEDAGDVLGGAQSALDDALAVEKPFMLILTITSSPPSSGRTVLLWCCSALHRCTSALTRCCCAAVITDIQMHHYACAVLYAEERVNCVVLAAPLVSRLNAVKKRRAHTPVKSDEVSFAVSRSVCLKVNSTRAYCPIEA